MHTDLPGWEYLTKCYFTDRWIEAGLPNITKEEGFVCILTWLYRITCCLWLTKYPVKDYAPGWDGEAGQKRRRDVFLATKAIYNNEDLRIKWSTLIALNPVILKDPESPYIKDLLEDLEGEL